MEEQNNPWKVLDEHNIYDNPWIGLKEYTVINPSGGKGIYGKVFFKNGAIGIIPLDEACNTWLVGQYRFPINKYSWEIPEGGGELHVDPLSSARRELLEETGLKAERWDKILEMHLSNSVTDEKAIVYVARTLSQHAPQPEETEQLIIKKIPFAHAFEMVINGEITDAISVAAILKLNYLLDKKLI
ncbi:DNA mismatch repair protein MutT [Terrimonas sp.]|uniref:NUDIX domain-containing protein n=1 Tax=Terrimonas sp. TaxID=1914338 RepID=UPI000D5191FF|nr:NUDIX hydrolase [Terrimonas sp.]PVD53517.1 DNA mismatch repair protein MutT [Terrimonas sp.]